MTDNSALSEYLGNRDPSSADSTIRADAFMAGRASRDTEVAELVREQGDLVRDVLRLREQLAEAQATIEKVRAWAETYAYGDGDYYRGVDSAQETVKELLSAPSPTGGNDE